MNNDFLMKILDLYNSNDWENILKLNENSNKDTALRILWVWPSIRNLEFIEETIQQNSCNGIISLGCGCGLLEWIIQKSKGIPVIGYEVNQEWWDSKYSTPQFIKLNYFSTPLGKNSLNADYALLFCYFNNGPAFREYIKYFNGNVVFIIGPGKGKGRHTDPQPFINSFGDIHWRLHSYQEVKDSNDFIAVYIR